MGTSDEHVVPEAPTSCNHLWSPCNPNSLLVKCHKYHLGCLGTQGLQG